MLRSLNEGWLAFCCGLELFCFPYPSRLNDWAKGCARKPNGTKPKYIPFWDTPERGLRVLRSLLATHKLLTKSIHNRKYRYFLELLISARKTAGLTQVDVAKRLSRPQSYVSKYENGERRLDVVELLDVAQAINFDPIALLRKLKARMD